MIHTHRLGILGAALMAGGTLMMASPVALAQDAAGEAEETAAAQVQPGQDQDQDDAGRPLPPRRRALRRPARGVGPGFGLDQRAGPRGRGFGLDRGAGPGGPRGRGERFAGPGRRNSPAGRIGRRGGDLPAVTGAIREQMATITEKHRAEIQDLTRQSRSARIALDEAVSAVDVDEALVRQRSTELAAVQADLAVARARLNAEMMAALTPEQRALVAERRDRVAERRDLLAERRDRIAERRDRRRPFPR